MPPYAAQADDDRHYAGASCPVRMNVLPTLLSETWPFSVYIVKPAVLGKGAHSLEHVNAESTLHQPVEAELLRRGAYSQGDIQARRGCPLPHH